MSTESRCVLSALACSCAATLLLAVGLPKHAQAIEIRSASFESTLNEGSDFGWRVDSPFTVTRTSEAGGADGDYAAKIVTNGGSSGCSCPRMTFQDGFSYGSGDEFWMSGSWYLPDPDKVYWSRLMNLGHFEASGDPDNWVLGLFREDFEPDAVKLVARSYDGDTGRSDLTPAIPIPTAQWFTITVHAKLSPTDGQALTEVYKDWELVSTSTQRNMWQNSPLHFYNAGLSYFWNGNGDTSVYFDRPLLGYVGKRD